MRLIKQSAEYIPQDPTILGAFKLIERAGRTCYKSESKITEDSWIKFVQMLQGKHHYSPFEFGTIYLTVDAGSPFTNPNYLEETDLAHFYRWNKYSKVKSEDNSTHTGTIYYITTNLRVIFENKRLEDLHYACEPTKHERRYCVKLITSRDITHEYVRHRTMSFCQESTRYCNYSGDKFGNQITYIIPSWTNLSEGECTKPNELDTTFYNALLDSEAYYFDLLNEGWKPQQARQVLPNALKTEIMMCGFESDWEHFFELRMGEGAHPTARELAFMIRNEFINNGIDFHTIINIDKDEHKK